MAQHDTDFLDTLAPLALSGIGEGVGAIVGTHLEAAVARLLPALPPAARLVIVDPTDEGAEACKRRFVQTDLRLGVIQETPAQFIEDMVEQRFDALIVMPGSEGDEDALVSLLWQGGFMAVHPSLQTPQVDPEQMLCWSTDKGAAVRMLPPKPKRRGGRRRNQPVSATA
ncbi:MAG: hypothetical protein CBC49_004470 [Alphaproteobacteria bacterium TMED89]|nr:hypothetical protein [Rhodospirillaceae bacterium]RPH16107.1 MAG: hypothetical protein CBC49_004470 [Alphaproteobacteria bacterium TMED89]